MGTKRPRGHRPTRQSSTRYWSGCAGGCPPVSPRWRSSRKRRAWHLTPSLGSCGGERWHDWRPEARGALADALGTAATGEAPARERTAALLLALTGDGQYGVRRPAYHALACREPERLRASCLAWAAAGDLQLRERAAEAWAWLPSVPDGVEGRDGIKRRLSSDPEPGVRRTAERVWAERSLARVREIVRSKQGNVAAGWRHGQAVIRWGDDTSLRELEQVATPGLSPHLRHWLARLARGVRERWSKATRDWPEPWLTWGGALEDTEGTALLPDDRHAAVRLALWLKFGATPADKRAWGGTAWDADECLFFPFLDELSILLPDGRRGSGSVVEVVNNMVVFVGSGRRSATLLCASTMRLYGLVDRRRRRIPAPTLS